MGAIPKGKKGEGLSPEDAERMEKLKAEKEECLQPVKIRITGEALPSMSTSTGGEDTGTDSCEEGSVEAEVSDDFDGEEEEVVSTLNLLKTLGSI